MLYSGWSEGRALPSIAVLYVVAFNDFKELRKVFPGRGKTFRENTHFDI